MENREGSDLNFFMSCFSGSNLQIKKYTKVFKSLSDFMIYIIVKNSNVGLKLLTHEIRKELRVLNIFYDLTDTVRKSFSHRRMNALTLQRLKSRAINSIEVYTMSELSVASGTSTLTSLDLAVVIDAPIELLLKYR